MQLFEGIIEEEFVSKNKVPIVIFRKNEGGKKPVFIFQGGFNKSKETMLRLCSEAANMGFIAISVDARRHGSRVDEYFWRDMHTDMARYYFNILVESAYDYKEILEYVKSRDDVNGFVGALGVSMGAFILTRAKMLEGVCFDACVAALGAADYRSLFEGSHFTDYLMVNTATEISPMVLRKIEMYDPINNLDRFEKSPFFIMQGGLDMYVPAACTEGVYEKLKYVYEDRVDALHFKNYENVAHRLSKDMIKDAFSWVSKVLEFNSKK